MRFVLQNSMRSYIIGTIGILKASLRHFVRRLPSSKEGIEGMKRDLGQILPYIVSLTQSHLRWPRHTLGGLESRFSGVTIHIYNAVILVHKTSFFRRGYVALRK